MTLYGLIGHPLEHSFSKSYFEKKFKVVGSDCRFANFDIDSLEILKDSVLSHADLQGFTVTYPYKNDIIRHLDYIDHDAEEIGAVNVVNIDSDRKLTGYNTDFIGFEGLLKLATKGKNISRAIVCGTGGASKAVRYVLDRNNIKYLTVSRKPQSENCISYNKLKADCFHDNELIINTTPLGMHPQENNFVDIPYDTINSSNILIDLIYNPEETVFLAKGKAQGAKTYNGLKMLYLQADAAWEIWINR